jgi:hypothetical protein
MIEAVQRVTIARYPDSAKGWFFFVCHGADQIAEPLRDAAIRSRSHASISDSSQPTDCWPSWICFGKVPFLIPLYMVERDMPVFVSTFLRRRIRSSAVPFVEDWFRAAMIRSVREAPERTGMAMHYLHRIDRE